MAGLDKDSDMNTAVKFSEMPNDEFTAAILETFPYVEAFERAAQSMLRKVHRLAPEAAFPPAKEWHSLMKRAIEGAFHDGEPMPLIVDTFHNSGTFSCRTQHYVASLAVDLYLAERQQVVAV